MLYGGPSKSTSHEEEGLIITVIKSDMEKGRGVIEKVTSLTLLISPAIQFFLVLYMILF